jgi:hypothetical protein
MLDTCFTIPFEFTPTIISQGQMKGECLVWKKAESWGWSWDIMLGVNIPPYLCSTFRKLSLIIIGRCAQCWLAAHQRFTSTELGGKPSAGDEDGSGSVVSDSTSSAGTAEKKGFKLSARAEKNLEAMIALVQSLLNVLLRQYLDFPTSFSDSRSSS